MHDKSAEGLSRAVRPLLRLEGVDLHFDNAQRVGIHNLNLSVWAGESIAIVGRSGSGKTTLLDLMCGLRRPNSGTVAFDGIVPDGSTAWREIRAREIGIVLQDNNLLPTLSALENIEVPMFGLVAGARRRRLRAEKLLGVVGLPDNATTRPNQLSGGERQRIAVARSLANRPRVLLADEPTGNLDGASAVSVIDLLLDQHAVWEMTLVLVTHDQEIARRCDRRIELLDGRIVSDSSMEVGQMATNAPKPQRP